VWPSNELAEAGNSTDFYGLAIWQSLVPVQYRTDQVSLFTDHQRGKEGHTSLMKKE
jgi:hypothetical protein